MSGLPSTAQGNGTGSRKTREEVQIARYIKCSERVGDGEKRDLKIVSRCSCTGLMDGQVEGRKRATTRLFS